jgi:hypothetical protein
VLRQNQRHLKQAVSMFYLIRQQYHSCPAYDHILMHNAAQNWHKSSSKFWKRLRVLGKIWNIGTIIAKKQAGGNGIRGPNDWINSTVRRCRREQIPSNESSQLSLSAAMQNEGGNE